eukprot:TRINITY_DN3700_c0_g1_i1.p1 TRINITY_DN3700_c0_g1~~TRINITY_DN3700_c0_g1_i1.p1  ORF type:complete len:411 (-),score=41.89 TRINITY_DN3700_c0_g1_i1:147-1379(-)
MQFQAHFWAHRLRNSSLVACKAPFLNRRWREFAYARTYLVVPLAQVEHFLSEKSTSGHIYGDHPLATMSSSRRGRILESVTRSAMAQLESTSILEDPDFGETVHGVCRGLHRAQYDWKVNGMRVECKSAMLTLCKTRKRWGFRMKSVKLPFEGYRDHAPFDNLLLALFSPRGIYIYAHDLACGVSACGEATGIAGFNISIMAPKSEQCWSAALDYILNWLDSDHNSCKFVLHIPLTDNQLQKELQRQPKHYHDTPLSACGHGVIIQDIVRYVDALARPTSCFQDAEIGACVNGRLRAKHTASHDWVRDGIRVECKSSRLHLQVRTQTWSVNFQKLKLGLFDELLIALSAPHGIYIYRHDLKFGLSTAGGYGHQVIIRSKASTPDIESGLRDILAKLDASGCQQLAVVEFS